MYFHSSIIISPWKGRDPSSEQNWFPFTLGYYVPSLAELFTVVYGIFKFNNAFSLFRKYHLNPLNPRMLCVKFAWKWQSGSGDEGENVKSYIQSDRRIDDRQSVKCTWAFSSDKLKQTGVERKEMAMSGWRKNCLFISYTVCIYKYIMKCFISQKTSPMFICCLNLLRLKMVTELCCLFN